MNSELLETSNVARTYRLSRRLLATAGLDPLDVMVEHRPLRDAAQATGADTIAVACPFCMTMISDGTKAAGSEVPVYDIAEVVAGRLA